MKPQERMKRYLTKVKEAIEFFDKIMFTKVPREENAHADVLARIGSYIDDEIIAARHPIQELVEPQSLG
jgi:hypothetical protein